MKLFFLLLLSFHIVLGKIGEVEVPDFAENFVQEKVREWQAPDDIQKNYPYYWSGYDEENRPVWVLEIGKWDMRKIAEGGNKSVSTFEAYLDKLVFNAIDSINATNGGNETVTQLIAILDMDDWPINQITSTKSLAYIVHIFSRLYRVIDKYVNYVFMINMNFAAESILSLLRPVFGSFMERIEPSGTQKSKWLPHIRLKVAGDQLPRWYGGVDDFKPIAVHG